MQPFDTTCDASRAPFFIICGEAATTTLGAKGPVKLKNPPAVRPVNPKNLSHLNLLNSMNFLVLACPPPQKSHDNHWYLMYNKNIGL